MSVITFWSNGRQETGKTLSVAAIATLMAIEHNYRILVISTGLNDKTLDNCFWEQKKEKKKSFGLFGPNTNISMEEGISGLNKAIKSNKLSPENITNYTKIIFKDRLEILSTYKGGNEEYKDIKMHYPEIINLANSYYDLVFVDLDKDVEEDISDTILENSNLVVASLGQRLYSINDFIEKREEKSIFKSKKTLILIGRYDRFSKYTMKNITRYMGEKNKVSLIPYSTLFFESAEEASIPDLFLKFRKIDEEDRNGFFISEVKRTAANIIYRLQDLAMKM